MLGLTVSHHFIGGVTAVVTGIVLVVIAAWSFSALGFHQIEQTGIPGYELEALRENVDGGPDVAPDNMPRWKES